MYAREPAIKRLIAKKAKQGLNNDELLSYIVGKIMYSDSAGCRQTWTQEFDLIFDSLPPRHKEIMAYGETP